MEFVATFVNTGDRQIHLRGLTIWELFDSGVGSGGRGGRGRIAVYKL